MLIRTIFLILALSGTNIFASEINWITNSKDAFKRAQEEGKNVYVLITAPSWCHWCKKLEEDVLTENSVIEYLNNNYINLMVLDRVNGKPNPDLTNFLFEGYPTQFVYDNNWGRVTKFSTFNSEEFISILEDNRGKVGVPDPRIPESYYIKDKELRKTGTTFSYDSEEYKLITRDERFFYIVNSGENKILFIPYSGGEVLVRLFDKGINDWGPLEIFGAGKPSGE